MRVKNLGETLAATAAMQLHRKRFWTTSNVLVMSHNYESKGNNDKPFFGCPNQYLIGWAQQQNLLTVFVRPKDSVTVSQNVQILIAVSSF